MIEAVSASRESDYDYDNDNRSGSDRIWVAVWFLFSVHRRTRTPCTESQWSGLSLFGSGASGTCPTDTP
jgi:hypothetical protein